MQTEQPVITKTEDSNLHDSTETHPSYGMIGASRIQGHINLYGSDFTHQNFIEIRVSKSKLHRGLSRDWASGDDPIVSIALSESQWATFVSTLNHGQGVQGTIQNIGYESIPQIPDPPARKEQFQNEMAETFKKARTKLKELGERIQASKAGAKEKAAMLSELNTVAQSIGGNLTFVADQFNEHMEDVTEKAKVEVHAYMQNAISRAGLTALTNYNLYGQVEPLAITLNKEGMVHEFDSSQTCNYCGVAAETTEGEICSARIGENKS